MTKPEWPDELSDPKGLPDTIRSAVLRWLADEISYDQYLALVMPEQDPEPGPEPGSSEK
jgi:hypothetical protein